MSERQLLTCEDALKLLPAYLDGELESSEHQNVERHLERCRSCFSRSEFEKRLKHQIRGLGREPVQPEFQERIRGLITRFEGTSTTE